MLLALEDVTVAVGTLPISSGYSVFLLQVPATMPGALLGEEVQRNAHLGEDTPSHRGWLSCLPHL